MAITFASSNPSGLLAAFKKAIRDGHVETWTCDSDGDFKHSPAQWAVVGWLRPKVGSDHLAINFLGNPAHQTLWADLAVLQGRFIESMITHCHDLFSTASVSAKPTVADAITTKVG